MIRITNQEEFKKCCEMCNSKDIESRLLGLSLLEECTEFSLNTCNVSVLVNYFYGGACKYNWHTFVEIGIKAPEFGTILYNLLYNRFYKWKTITYKLIEDDQSNQSRRI